MVITVIVLLSIKYLIKNNPKPKIWKEGNRGRIRNVIGITPMIQKNALFADVQIYLVVVGHQKPVPIVKQLI
jgi:hypothetical protein